MKFILIRRSFFFSIVLILLFFLFVQPVSADTTVGGTISADTVWAATGSPYVVTSNIIVKGTDGVDGITTLTIEPGATIKFNQSRYMTIGASSGDPGALIAQGTVSAPIVFTSNQATPAPGDWNYIKFYTTTDDATTIMEHCVLDYGGLKEINFFFNRRFCYYQIRRTTIGAVGGHQDKDAVPPPQFADAGGSL